MKIRGMMPAEFNVDVAPYYYGVSISGPFKEAVKEFEGKWPIRITMPCGISYVLKGPFDLIDSGLVRMCACGDPTHYIYKVVS